MQKIILAVLCSVFFSVNATAQQFSSGAKPVALIELYTSEGCSSCPPADRWMSTLRDNGGLWIDFVPLAFHVDYWDYIGWEDRFASREYSQRQRRYANEYQESTVYTPGVRKNGEELRGWHRSPSLKDDESEEVGELALTVSENGRFEASFSPQVDEVDARLLNIALLGLDISSEVQRGENKGKTLKHDFVVLGISRYSSAEVDKWSGELPKPKVEAEKYAVAAWVSDGRKVSPIQATGGYLAADVAVSE